MIQLKLHCFILITAFLFNPTFCDVDIKVSQDGPDVLFRFTGSFITSNYDFDVDYFDPELSEPDPNVIGIDGIGGDGFGYIGAASNYLNTKGFESTSDGVLVEWAFGGCEMQNGNNGRPSVYAGEEAVSFDKEMNFFVSYDPSDSIGLELYMFVDKTYESGQELDFSVRILGKTLDEVFLTPGAFPCHAALKAIPGDSESTTQYIRFSFVGLNPTIEMELEFGPVTELLSQEELSAVESACEEQLAGESETEVECTAQGQELVETGRFIRRDLQAQASNVKIDMRVSVVGTESLADANALSSVVEDSFSGENADGFVAKLQEQSEAFG